jgi:signal transduction histidine kinase
MRSVKARLLLTVGAVVLLSLSAVAFLSSGVTRHAFLRLEDVHATKLVDTRALEPEIEAHYRRTGSWEGIEPLLARLAAERRQDLALLGEDGRVAAVSPGLDGSRIAPDSAGGLRVEKGSPDARAVIFVKVPPLALRDGSGRIAGRLYPIPAPDTGRLREERELLGSVDRWIFGGVAVAGALALLATAALSRRILKPVSDLTDAARRMEQGDLAARVEVRSRDEIGELARAFNSMAQARAAAEELRRRMVGDVAHELRTPLTNLKAQLEAIEDGLLPASRETLASLQEEAELLARLVDDLQELALAEAGQLKLEIAEVPLDEAARAAIAALKSSADAAGVGLESAVGADLPPARADRKRVGQILRNLLSNAITHSPRGGTVRVGARQNGSAVEIGVHDQGPGIAPEHVPRIFERFYRVDPSRSRSTGGAGLGLAIVRELARSQGGDVRVETEPGRSSSFYVTLPISRSPHSAP